MSTVVFRSVGKLFWLFYLTSCVRLSRSALSCTKVWGGNGVHRRFLCPCGAIVLKHLERNVPDSSDQTLLWPRRNINHVWFRQRAISSVSLPLPLASGLTCCFSFRMLGRRSEPPGSAWCSASTISPSATRLRSRWLPPLSPIFIRAETRDEPRRDAPSRAHLLSKPLDVLTSQTLTLVLIPL